MLSILTGLCLCVAGGFRIFFPYFILSLSSYLGWFNLHENISWIGNSTSLIVFGILLLSEIAGFYTPWVDNMLDLICSPLALFSGIVLMSFAMGSISPLVKWPVSVILGGGICVSVQFLTVKTRSIASFFPSGFGNPIISTIENVSSVLITLLVVFNVYISLLLSLLLIYFLVRIINEAGRKEKELSRYRLQKS